MRKLAKDSDLSEGVHVIKFFATWCGPCRLYASVFERAESRDPRMNFWTVDVDESPEIRDSYDVRGVPTTVLLVDGIEQARHSGALSTKRLQVVLDCAYANCT